MRRLLAFGVLAVIVALGLPGSAHAAKAPVIEKGLLITPLRQYPAVDAGSTYTSSFSVANLTDSTITVNLSVKQFSVADYTYNYSFDSPDNDWLHLSTNVATLAPNKTLDVPYSIAVPAGSAPGGHYYTLFASANLSTQGVNSTIQAADLLYLTVNGKLTTVSHLQGSSIHWLSFGRTIPFSLQPVNTGNVYSFIYVSGQLHGLFVKPPQTSTGHILIPGKVRALNASIPSPILPGIYRATYGYKTADATWIIQESHWVVYLPPWFFAVVLGALLIAGRFWPRHKHRQTSTGSDAKTD